MIRCREYPAKRPDRVWRYRDPSKRDGFQTLCNDGCLRSRWTTCRGYIEGASIDDLAWRFGVHRTMVIHHLDERGVPRRRVVRKMTDRTVHDAAVQYQLGHSLADVASAFRVHPRTLARELRLAGVALRPRNGWPAT
jgi:hypothetical protein